jgi:hypothetical protein
VRRPRVGIDAPQYDGVLDGRVILVDANLASDELSQFDLAAR